MLRQESPDGQLLVEYAIQTMRMSHEVHQPRVVHVPSGDCLLDLWGAEAALWDGSATFLEPGVVELVLRKYGSGHAPCRVRIDAVHRSWSAIEGDVGDFLAERLGMSLTRRERQPS